MIKKEKKYEVYTQESCFLVMNQNVCNLQINKLLLLSYYKGGELYDSK